MIAEKYLLFAFVLAVGMLLAELNMSATSLEFWLVLVAVAILCAIIDGVLTKLEGE